MIPREILKQVRHIEIRTRHIVNDVFAGEYHSAFQGQGMEFQEVREYVPGDDIRSIDWNVTARMNAPFIKKFVEERETTVLLVVDISSSHQFGSGDREKREIAAEVAAVIAFAAIKNNDKVGLLLHTDRTEKFIPPGKGSRHVLRVVREVLSAEAEGTGSDLKPALEDINLLTRRKSIVFCIGDFMLPDTWMRPMTVTGRRHDVVSIMVGDRLERKWEAMGLVEWRDLETGETHLVDTSSKRVRDAHRQHHEEFRERQMEQLRRSGVDVVELTADQEYDVSLMRFFQQRSQRLRHR